MKMKNSETQINVILNFNCKLVRLSSEANGISSALSFEEFCAKSEVNSFNSSLKKTNWTPIQSDIGKGKQKSPFTRS